MEDTVHSYLHDLIQYKAFVPCESTLHHFALQDFDPSNIQLKVNELANAFFSL